MADVMKAMRERRDELRQELGAFPEFREYEMLETFIRQYESIMGATTTGVKSFEIEQPKRSRRSNRFTITDAAASAIEDVGHPVPLQELTDVLPRYGKTVTGKRPAINLSSALSRDKRFASVHWHGMAAWWLREREIPSEAGASGGSAADAPAAVTDEGEKMEEFNAAA